MQSCGTVGAPGCGFALPSFVLAAAALVMLQIINKQQPCGAAPLSSSPSLSDFFCSRSVYLRAAEPRWWGAGSGRRGLSNRTSLGRAMSHHHPRCSLRHRSQAGTHCDPVPGVPASHKVVLEKLFMKNEAWFNATAKNMSYLLVPVVRVKCHCDPKQ